MKCLIPNIGSTSFKFRVLDMPARSVLAQGRVERIGQPGGECAGLSGGDPQVHQRDCGAGEGAGEPERDWRGGLQGGSCRAAERAAMIGDEFLAAMEEFSFFAPAHNPPYIAAIKAFRQELPGVPLVAVMEPFPYRFMDEASTTYAVPYEWRTGVRGSALRVSRRQPSRRPANATRALLGRKDMRHISCHLGGSSSVAAFKSGVAIDTSFGTSPQSGLPQNNRVGDIDVICGAAHDEEAQARSGPDGGAAGKPVGTGGDQRDQRRYARPERSGGSQGRPAAQLALDVFIDAIRHYMGAFLLELGGVDAITFSGGIGENSAEIRAAVLKDLAGFGIEVDEEQERAVRREGAISKRRARREGTGGSGERRGSGGAGDGGGGKPRRRGSAAMAGQAAVRQKQDKVRR